MYRTSMLSLTTAITLVISITCATPGFASQSPALPQYTYEIQPIEAGSTEPSHIRPTGFNPYTKNSRMFVGTWGPVKDGVGWTRFEIPDFASKCQTIIKAELNIDITGAMGGKTGLRINRVQDNSWTTLTINSDWPVTDDEILSQPRLKGRTNHDITSWLTMPGEGGKTILSMRFMPEPEKEDYTACFRNPTLTITTVPEPLLMNLLFVGGLAGLLIKPK